jgi:thioredoxin 1
MNRRHLLTALPAALLCAPAQAYAPLEYAPRTWPDIRDRSDRVILNFRAAWSLTCGIKRDILTEIVGDHPRYQALTFLEVDWDTFARSQWTERLKVKRRSTLIALKGRVEIARLVNEPNEGSLRRFLDDALAA